MGRLQARVRLGPLVWTEDLTGGRPVVPVERGCATLVTSRRLAELRVLRAPTPAWVWPVIAVSFACWSLMILAAGMAIRALT